MMIIVTVEMSPRLRHDDGRRPSQPYEKMMNVLDTTQVLEAIASCLVEAFVNVQGEGTPTGGKGYSFKEFYEHPFPMFKGNLNSGEARVWLTRLEELLQVMDCIEEQRVKYAAYKFSREAR
jgi:hypothetical protein